MMRRRNATGRQDKNDAYLGGPASLSLGCLLAGRLSGRSTGLLVLRAPGATSATLDGSFCGGGWGFEARGAIRRGGRTIRGVSLGAEANRDTEWGTDRCWGQAQPLCLTREHRLRVRAGENQALITGCRTRLRTGRQRGEGGGRRRTGKAGPLFLKKGESWEMIKKRRLL